MIAEKLHSEVALLSNKLHDFDDNDVQGVKPVIEKILNTRGQWKDVRRRIEYIEKFGREPEEKVQHVPGESEVNVRYQLNLAQGQKRKLELKIRNNPEHKLIPQWQSQLTALLADIASYQQSIIQLKYADRQRI